MRSSGESDEDHADSLLQTCPPKPDVQSEQYARDRWYIHELIERHIIDFTRVTLPNTSGITEFLKIVALCETHTIRMIPHFTGHVSVAALVHVLCTLPVPVLMEIAGDGRTTPSHMAQGYTFREGKLWPEARPGLGLQFDPGGVDLVAGITEPFAPIPLFRRPDGSFTNW